jgi:thymidine phosphorylase
MDRHIHFLKVKDVGIDTYRENIIFMRFDCHVCKSEGFTALTRVVVTYNHNEIIATLNAVHSNLIAEGEAGLSIEAMHRLGVKDGNIIGVSHLHPISSLGYVRAKMNGKELDESAMEEIIKDVVAGHYSNIEMAAFVSACAGDHLSVNEITALTKAMIASGRKITWPQKMIFDKHCVGGLPGNRTTPIVVSIVAAAGLIIPKTSSRAITSPAGTADTMETMAPVDLSIDQLQKVVEKEGGCIAWGGAVQLSPADDLLIEVEKALDVDSDGQVVASVLSKKASAGCTHVVIDIPVGATAKVRTHEQALNLQYYFKAVSNAIGIQSDIIISDGTQPVGKGIGPSLEALDVLAVLQNKPDAPQDLKNRALTLAAALFKLSGKFPAGSERTVAETLLEDGSAWKKFMAICEAQGGFRQPALANHRFDVLAETEGIVKSIDNRKLARIAKLAGAPKAPSAGVVFYATLGKNIAKGDLLFSIYAESQGELDYSRGYYNTIKGFIEIK